VTFTPPVGKPSPKGRPFSFPNPFGQMDDCSGRRGGVCFVFRPEIDGPVTLEIFDVTGYRVRKLEFLAPGLINQDVVIQWNGLNNMGNQVPNGVYLYRILITDPLDTTKVQIFRGKCYKFLYPGDVKGP